MLAPPFHWATIVEAPAGETGYWVVIPDLTGRSRRYQAHLLEFIGAPGLVTALNAPLGHAHQIATVELAAGQRVAVGFVGRRDEVLILGRQRSDP